MQIYWTKINKIIEESSEVKTYLLDCPTGFTWEEGSHTHLGLKGFNEGEKRNRELVRHMSISTLPGENVVGITTRIKAQCSPFKSTLKNLNVGDEMALFKIHSNIPLKRENKNVYLLSSGVGLATFRPLVLDYLENRDQVNKIHSLNIDSHKEYLFTDLFKTNEAKNLTVEFVDNRKEYYNAVRNLATDTNGHFYVVGSDEFLAQNIEILREAGIATNQIMLDKREQSRIELLPENVEA